MKGWVGEEKDVGGAQSTVSVKGQPSHRMLQAGPANLFTTHAVRFVSQRPDSEQAGAARSRASARATLHTCCTRRHVPARVKTMERIDRGY